MKTCARDGCDNEVIQRGRGRPAKYCSPQCRQRTAESRTIRQPRPKPARPAKQCARDGCDNEVIQSGKGRPASYCSRKCHDVARHLDKRAAKLAALGERICAVCPNVIPASVTLRAKCCSRECNVIYQNRVRAEAKIAARRADPQTCGARDCSNDIPPEDGRRGVYCSTACKRREHSARWRERAPGYMRQYLYGVSPAEYDAMMAAQDGRCAICRTDNWGGKTGAPHTDHCHKTGRFRGILCDNCNQGLGRFGDDPARLRAAAAYLEGFVS